MNDDNRKSLEQIVEEVYDKYKPKRTSKEPGLATPAACKVRKVGLKRGETGPRSENERWGKKVKKFFREEFAGVEESLTLPTGEDWELPHNACRILAKEWKGGSLEASDAALPGEMVAHFRQVLVVAALTYERNLNIQQRGLGNVQNMSVTVVQTGLGRDVNAAARFYRSLEQYSSDNAKGWFPAMGQSGRSKVMSPEAHQWYGQLGTQAERQSLVAKIEAIEVPDVRKTEKEPSGSVVQTQIGQLETAQGTPGQLAALTEGVHAAANVPSATLHHPSSGQQSESPVETTVASPSTTPPPGLKSANGPTQGPYHVVPPPRVPGETSVQLELQESFRSRTEPEILAAMALDDLRRMERITKNTTIASKAR